ncbi:TlpA family protein disulfide reductase [bacterium]|nr:TlpA family protein disulfide reductase [bacterium]
MKNKIFFMVALATVLFLAGCGNPPSAAIEPESWNLGYLITSSENEQVFSIHNDGKGSLTIDSIVVPSTAYKILEQADTVLPDRMDNFKIVFTAPEDTGTISDTLRVFTNDPENSVIDIAVTGRILPVNADGDNKNMAVIPFQSASREPEIVEIIKNTTGRIIRIINENEEYRIVSANQLVKNLVQDPAYKTHDTQDLLTKWGKIMGIRYILLGQLEVEGETAEAAISINDVYFKYPVVRKLSGLKLSEAEVKISEEARDLIENLSADQKKIAQQMLQKEWIEKRQSVLKKPAPDFTLTNIKNGEKIELKKYFGRTIVMHFFSLECEACEKEIKWMEDIQALGEDVAVFGICMDVGRKEEVLEFISDKKMSYPILLPMDVKEDNQLEPYYGGGTPITVVVDKNGIIQESMVGFSTRGLQNIEKLVKRIR